MKLIDELRQDKADIAAEIAAHEAAAATADGDTLAAHGGAITGLEAKARAIGARLAEALGIQAARERAATAAAAEAERQAVLDRGKVITQQYNDLVAAFDAAAATVQDLWARYAVIRTADTAFAEDVRRLDLYPGAYEGYTFGQSLTGALKEAHKREGVLTWKGG